MRKKGKNNEDYIDDLLDLDEEFPFIQTWKVNEHETLALKEIIRKPNETAVVYIINEDERSKEYQIRIKEHSYMVLDGIKYTLKYRTDDSESPEQFRARF